MNRKPILSDSEKRKVLSARKKQKVVLKNVLVQPFERYWPELVVTEVEQFAQKFRHLYKVRHNTNPDTLKAPTSVENERKNSNFADKVILGLRSSIRSVASGKTLTLFISSKIRPKYVVDQIIIMTITKNRNSRVLCVPDMDVALLDVLGFSCQCLAMLEDRNEIWHWAMEKSKQFPLPNSLKKSELTEEMETACTPTMVSDDKNEFDVSTLHLKKETVSQRAFIPHGTTMGTDTTNDFISLGKTDLKIENIRPKHQLISMSRKHENPVTNKISKKRNEQFGKFISKKKMITSDNQQFHNKKCNYLPLKVNRIQPNADKIRNKKKKNKK